MGTENTRMNIDRLINALNGITSKQERHIVQRAGQSFIFMLQFLLLYYNIVGLATNDKISFSLILHAIHMYHFYMTFFRVL